MGSVAALGGCSERADEVQRSAVTTSTEAPARSEGEATSTSSTSAADPPSPEFRASIKAINSDTAARMHASWRPGCPVELRDLRLIELTHWGFDGEPHNGELVVHADQADRIVSAFESIYRDRFPIEQMRLVDEFGADDDRSMAANNTSAFNCRPVAGSQRWSEHAYGRAIDINPIQNPYVTRDGQVDPPAGAAHTDRDPATPGLITAGDAVTKAFAAIGWIWGGTWSSGQDYQHFSSSGR